MEVNQSVQAALQQQIGAPWKVEVSTTVSSSIIRLLKSQVEIHKIRLQLKA